MAISDIKSIGFDVAKVEVKIGPQFLNLFSKQLYSSPNKAFEELVCNSWDADAENVHIRIPENLEAENAKIWILDDGSSMDVEGFHDLWSVASSKKRDSNEISIRKPIGKFGVGKLATYLLANQLTYICKAGDGIVRMITMDYRDIEAREGGHLHIDPVPLAVRKIDENAFKEFCSDYLNAPYLEDLFHNRVKQINCEEFEDEFGGAENSPSTGGNTWTIAVLSDLKQEGKSIQIGWIRRLLRTALPLGNSIRIALNNEALLPSKTDVTVLQTWELGPALKIDTLTIDADNIKIEKKSAPYPHIVIPKVGELSGKVKLFADKISGGKSAATEASNGFFVNVLGRVIHPEDPYFGLQNLHHGTWASFRCTVRADDLDRKLTVDRDGMADGEEVKVFRALLMACFNMARSHQKKEQEDGWPSDSETITNEFGRTIPFEPLERVVEENLASESDLVEFLDLPASEDHGKLRDEWRTLMGNPSKIIKKTIARNLSREEKIFKYDVSSQEIVMNKSHPFYIEHTTTIEAYQALSDAVLIDLMTDAFILDSGLPEERLSEIREYRDRMQRLVALMRRRSPISIAEAINNMTADVKGFETIIGDALDSLGFVVERMGQSGKPEGLATAIISRQSDDEIEEYSFTYDAKSTRHGKVSAGNVGVSGLARHKTDCNANYSLVIAPDFADGALKNECAANGVTPMRAADLAKLVMLTVGYGPLDLREIKGLFSSHSPDESARWVADLKTRLGKKNILAIDIIMQAFEDLVKNNPRLPDVINAVQIAERCRKIMQSSEFPQRKDVISALRGLAKIAPNVINCNDRGDIFLLTKPDQIALAIKTQLARVPEKYQFGLTRANANLSGDTQ